MGVPAQAAGRVRERIRAGIRRPPGLGLGSLTCFFFVGYRQGTWGWWNRPPVMSSANSRNLGLLLHVAKRTLQL